MSSETKLACNRLPFQTDSSCDRGDVDIHVFDNFPICMPIDPPEPKTGIPQADTPIIPITPPPCACVMIEMTGSGTVSSRSGVKVEGSFKSIGDCCDGNYKANIAVDIPCMPFSISGGSKDKSVKIEQYCGTYSPSGTFNPGIKVDKCSITIDPSLSLKIPRPAVYDISPTFELTNSCADKASGSFTVEKSGTSCEVTFKPKLKLNIPPTPKLEVCKKGVVDIKGDLGAEGSLDMGTSQDGCGNTNKICPTLNLNLPCPIALSEASVTATIGWGESQKESTAKILQKNGKCELINVDETLELSLPCPINLDDATVTANMSWNGNQTSQATVVRKSGECEIEAVADTLDLGLPCPVSGTDVGINFKISTGKSAAVTSYVPLLGNIGDCSLRSYKPTVEIVIPESNGGGGGGGSTSLCGVNISGETGTSSEVLINAKRVSCGQDYANLQVTHNPAYRLLTMLGSGCTGNGSQSSIYTSNSRTIRFESMKDSNFDIKIENDPEKTNGIVVRLGVYYA